MQIYERSLNLNENSAIKIKTSFDDFMQNQGEILLGHVCNKFHNASGFFLYVNFCDSYPC